MINGLAGLLAGFHQPFDMITMLGFLILLGTVVNNPILIVDQSRRNIESGAQSVLEAVTNALQMRLKPIVMSTMTTLWLSSAGVYSRRGVGSCIVVWG